MFSVDLFSCVGCHAIGFMRAGIRTVRFCEIDPYRRQILRTRFPAVQIEDDIRFMSAAVEAEIVIGGPPCQQTSVAAAVHGRRSGESLWKYMARICDLVSPDWVVVEQPPGNKAWETEVACDLLGGGWHVARFEFGACDVGAPYLRRRVFLVACTSLPRLEVAGRSLPSAIEGVKRAADARGDWHPDKLATLRVDARSAGEMERSESRLRRDRIEALGDSNPPHMAEAIGRAIMESHHA